MNGPMRIRAFVPAMMFVGLALSRIAIGQQVFLPPAPPGVETFTHEGIQFSWVRAPNVQPYVPTSSLIGRPIGGGSWDFAIARTEVTQGQWVEFINTFAAEPVPQGQVYGPRLLQLLNGEGVGPGMYGTHLSSQGRFVWAVEPDGAPRPMTVSWFGAAAYCNWLHNGRQGTVESLVLGAYDLRNWVSGEPQTTADITRLPGARYWIPSYDEWAVAAFFDPNRHGPGQPGWWEYLNGRDRLGIPGPAGVGETSANWESSVPGGAIEVRLLPVASYPNSQSPWGLLDTSGTFPEWLEGRLADFFDRMFGGSPAGNWSFPDLYSRLETAGWPGGESPDGAGLSLRIASNVPVPSGAVVPLAIFILLRPRWYVR